MICFRKDLKLTDDKAKELVQTIQNFSDQQVELKYDKTTELVHKDMEVIRDHINNTFNLSKTTFTSKEDLANLKAEMKSDKTDLVKWMFIFWSGSIIAILGGLFGFLKIFLDK